MPIAFQTSPAPAAAPPLAPRASLTDPAIIRIRMLDDLNAQDRFTAIDATIDCDFFLSQGWTLSQVNIHAATAIEAFVNNRARALAL